MRIFLMLAISFLSAHYLMGQTGGSPPPTGQGGNQQSNQRRGQSTNQGTAQTGQGQGQPQGNANQMNANRFGSINQTPWFGNQDVRTQLNLTTDQFNRMNRSYGQLYGPYNQSMTQFNSSKDPSDTQRQSMMDANNRFYGDFSKGTSGVLSPEQQTRFNQLSLQYRGFGAFADPTLVERLRLTQEQRDRLTRMEKDYDTQMSTYYRSKGTEPDANGTKFNQLRKDMWDRMGSIFTEDQRRVWKEMIGDPYSFRNQ